MDTKQDRPPLPRRPQPGKRLLDLVIAVPAFLLLLPVMAITAVVVRFGIGRPVLFRQRRPGLLERAFEVLKFRTMTDERDAKGQLKSDLERLTALGHSCAERASTNSLSS